MTSLAKKIRPSEWVVLSFLIISLSRIYIHSGFSSVGPNLFSAFQNWELLLIPCVIMLEKLRLKHFDSVAAFVSETRNILPLFIMVGCYPLMPFLIKTTHAPDQDGFIQYVDRTLFFGTNPHALIEGMIKPWLSEWMAFCYSMYAIVVLVVFAFSYLKKDQREFNRFIFLNTFCFAIGYTLYSVIPVQGPLFTQTFNTPLDIYYLKPMKEALVDRARIERDCFPSLHTAITVICMSTAWTSLRKLFWALLPMAIFIPFACVYLRYHYVTDVLAGLLLAFLILRLPTDASA